MFGSTSEILKVSPERMEKLEAAMQRLGFEPVLDRVAQENNELIQQSLKQLGVEGGSAEEIGMALAGQIERDENQLYSFIGISRQNFDFHKIAEAARSITTESEGFFLKKEFGMQILKECPPEATLKFLGHKSVDELLKKEDVGEIFSALRFLETNDWMHETFRVAYTKFRPEDFEHRPIELKVLGPQWEEVAKKYVEKKHHNVSHLKEFGIIFLNPIAQTGKGKFIRDFALLLHYFHEIAFYSKLFQRYAKLPNFQEKFIALLRGDVLAKTELDPEEWLIVQRYLWKEDPHDVRLFLPHVNPESMHWRKAEEDIAAFGEKHEEVTLEFWNNLWSVAGFFPSLTPPSAPPTPKASDGHGNASESKDAGAGKEELISFDLEDTAMMFAHREEGKNMNLTYHQHEALWNRIFAAYVGGYDTLEKYILDNMEKGLILLKKST